MMTTAQSYIARPADGSLYQVLDLILDKGLVIDAYVRVSLVGIELLTVDARVVVASVDTYLRFAERANRLVLDRNEKRDIVGLIEGTSKAKTRGAIKGAFEESKRAISHAMHPREDEQHEEEDDAGRLERVRSKIRDRMANVRHKIRGGEGEEDH
jgi:hypothetical protein